MSRFMLVMALGLFSASVSAGPLEAVHVQEGLDFAIPKATPVQFASLEQYGVATFAGRFLMSGTFYYGYESDDPNADATYGLLELYFIPDKRLAAKLPYWSQRGHVHEIRFLNERAFVNAVISQKSIKNLAEKKIRSLSGRASVLVEGYQASVECDYPTYSVTFVSAENLATIAATRELLEQMGC